MKKLAVFDLDSTLIPHEMIDELAALVGKGEQVKEITRQSVGGRGLTRGSLEARVRMLKGLPVEKIVRHTRTFQTHPGFSKMVSGLLEQGYTLAIVSGAFHNGIAQLRQQHPEFSHFSQIHANHLQVRNGRLTGRVFVHVAGNKDRIVRDLQRKLGVPKARTVVVGDSVGDIAMGKLGKVFVAVNPANDRVRKSASHVLELGGARTLEEVAHIARREIL